MARGWESKAVEAQIEEGIQHAADNERRVSLSVEARLRLQRLESLKLSRSRVLAQLERAVLPAHRAVLLNGLQAIEKEIVDNSPE